MKKRYWVTILALLAFSTASVALGADPGFAPAHRGPAAMGAGMGHGPGMGLHAGIGRALGLTADQTSRIDDLTKRFFSETRDLRYDLAMRRMELARLFTDPKSSDNALLAKQKEVSALRTRIMDAMAQRIVEARRLLTPEQLAKLYLLMGRAIPGAATMDGLMGHGFLGGGSMGHGECGCPMCRMTGGAMDGADGQGPAGPSAHGAAGHAH